MALHSVYQTGSEKAKSSSNTSLSSEDDVDSICRRCSAIIWERTRNPELQLRYVINETIGLLEVSSCRICRFFAKFLDMYGSRSNWSHTLQWEMSNLQEWEEIGRIVLADAHKEAAIGVSRQDPHTPGFQNRTPIPRQINIQQVRGWVDNCKAHHANTCTSNQRHDLVGLHVIDCEQLKVVAAPSDCEFVALSYVWGPHSSTVEMSSLENLECLPDTIRDSVCLTRNLGYRFLWIDRYCIDQINAQHKHTQIMQMGHIYAAAQLTIIASVGSDPTYGLPGFASHLRGETIHEKVGPFFLSTITMPSAHVSNSWWSTRAWTLQEAFQSRRRLFFTNRYVMFACNCGTETCYDVGKFTEWVRHADEDWLSLWLPIKTTTHKAGCYSSPMSQAMGLLQEYSTRALSYENDALNAVVGALNVFSGSDLYHVWGVPFHHQPGGELALLWHHKFPGVRRHDFPSWSPVGWAGEIRWTSLYSTLEVQCSTISNHNITIPTGNKKVSLSNWKPNYTQNSDQMPRYLKLSADAADLRLVHFGEYPYNSKLSLINEKRTGVLLEFNHDLKFGMLSIRWDVSPATLKGLTSVKGILVHKAEIITGMTEDVVLLLALSRGHFERVGTLWIHQEAGDRNAFHLLDAKLNLVVGSPGYHGYNASRVLSAKKSFTEAEVWWRRLFKPKTVRLY